jgi:hypothetical protein
MLYVIATYWPFMLLMLVIGAAVGWWYQDPRSVDDLTAWLERGPDDP